VQVKKPYSPVIVREHHHVIVRDGHHHVIVRDGHHQHHTTVNTSMYPLHCIVMTMSSIPSFINIGLKVPSDI